MRFLVTLTMIWVLFGVSYSQESTTYDIGTDKDGDTWFLDTSLTRKLAAPADFITLMPIYTRVSGRLLVFYFNVDCSDSTYQFIKAQSIASDGRILWEREEKSRWANFTGYSGRGARIVCKQTKGLPTIESGRID